MRPHPASVTRRTLLTGVAAAALAACRPRHRLAAPLPDPDTAALTAAAESERVLISAYDALTVTAAPGADTAATAMALAGHRAHLIALEALLATPTSSPTGPPPLAAPDQLTAAVRASVAKLQKAAMSAADGRSAALLASIAAWHAASTAATRLRIGP
ncbi:MAG: hypothetical protein QOF18_2207 [Frankiaceae bacterium]|jgi:hypothetical protein|nr:hypothetical protein [Frankiaceae bacterium]